MASSSTKSCVFQKVQFLATDFDDTCTEKLILDYYKARQDYHGEMKTKLDAEWKGLQELYLKYTNDNSLSLVKGSNMPGNQFDEKGLRDLLKKYEEADIQISDHVAKSGILKGITEPNLKQFSEKVELKPNVLSVLNTFKVLGIPLHVISLNFSQKMIKFVLYRKGTLPLIFHTNRLVFENGVTTGSLNEHLVSAFDKEEAIHSIIHNSRDRCGVSIYVGDSPNDLLALLAVDVGFVIGQKKRMLQVCQAYGIKVEEYQFESVQEKLNSAETQPVLFAVKSWDEIKDFVFRL